MTLEDWGPPTTGKCFFCGKDAMFAAPVVGLMKCEHCPIDPKRDHDARADFEALTKAMVRS